MRERSLVYRLIGWQAAAMLIAWLVLSGWLAATMTSMGNGDLDRRMYTLARTLAEAASSATDDLTALQRRLTTAEKIFIDGVIRGLDSGDDYTPIYQVWSSTGALLYRSSQAPTERLSIPSGEFAQREVGGKTFRTVAASSADGKLRVEIGEDLRDRWESLWPMLRIIGTGQVLILLWVLGVTWIAARQGLRPLVQLAQDLAQKRPGDLSSLYRRSKFRELSPITDELNSLLVREEMRLEAERGFLADAAHELRTPLAAIAVQAHLVSTASSSPMKEDAAAELQRGIDRVSHLLSQLLKIARIDAGHSGGAPETIDIAEVSRQRVALASVLAKARSISISLEAPIELKVLIQQSGFLSVLDNLVDNAIRYSHVGGQVLVRLVENDGLVCLEVLDDGPGIEPSLQSKVFERFYRLPGTDEQGSGLGLAIVKRLVESQMGTIVLIEGLRGRGIGFQVCFRETKPVSA